MEEMFKTRFAISPKSCLYSIRADNYTKRAHGASQLQNIKTILHNKGAVGLTIKKQ